MNLSRLRRFGAATTFLFVVVLHVPDALAEAEGARAASPEAASKEAAEPGGAKTEEPAPEFTESEKAENAKRRHGERSKTPDGTEVYWDNVHGGWIVPKPEKTYWIRDRYYRYENGVWLRASSPQGPFEMVAPNVVPRSARARYGDPTVSVTARLPSGTEAVYDPRIKVHKITGHKGVFLFDAMFWRYDEGVWMASEKVDGPWKPTSGLILPQVLRRAINPPEKGTKVTLPSGEVVVAEGENHLFVLEGRPGIVFYEGSFYERRGGKWYRSEATAAKFEEISSQRIPNVVRAKYHVGKLKKPKGKGEQADAGPKRGAGAIKGERHAGAKSTKPAKEAKPPREQRAAQPAE